MVRRPVCPRAQSRPHASGFEAAATAVGSAHRAQGSWSHGAWGFGIWDLGALHVCRTCQLALDPLPVPLRLFALGAGVIAVAAHTMSRQKQRVDVDERHTRACTSGAAHRWSPTISGADDWAGWHHGALACRAAQVVRGSVAHSFRRPRIRTAQTCQATCT